LEIVETKRGKEDHWRKTSRLVNRKSGGRHRGPVCAQKKEGGGTEKRWTGKKEAKEEAQRESPARKRYGKKRGRDENHQERDEEWGGNNGWKARRTKSKFGIRGTTGGWMEVTGKNEEGKESKENIQGINGCN